MKLIFLFSTLSSSILKPNLYSGLREPQSLAQFLAHESVWIVGLIEKPLQLVELFQGKIGPTSPLLDFGLAFVLHPFRIVFAILQFRGHLRQPRAAGLPAPLCISYDM